MSTVESERAQREALSAQRSTSADRAHFWAGLNRYLSAEAKEQHRRAQEDVADEPDEPDKPDKQGAVDDSSAPGEPGAHE